MCLIGDTVCFPFRLRCLSINAPVRPTVLEAYVRFVNHGSGRHPADMSVNACLDLRAQEAAIVNELRTNFSGVESQIGMLGLARIHGFHWLVRDNHQARVLDNWRASADTTLYVQCDYKECATLPVGPSGTGEWWYANARNPAHVCIDVSLTARCDRNIGS